MTQHFAVRQLHALFIIVVGAALAVSLLAGQDNSQAARREFQGLVHGLGGGAAANLARCARGFDPRLDSECELSPGPLPCGQYYCPHHGLSVFELPRYDGDEAERRNADTR